MTPRDLFESWRLLVALPCHDKRTRTLHSTAAALWPSGVSCSPSTSQQSACDEFVDHRLTAANHIITKLSLESTKRNATIHAQPQKERFLQRSLRVYQRARSREVAAGARRPDPIRSPLQSIPPANPEWRSAPPARLPLASSGSAGSMECASTPNPRYGCRVQYLRLCRESRRPMPCVTGRAKFDISYCCTPPLLQPLACREVQVGGEIVVGNKVRVIAAAAGQQLGAKARVLVHLQHVHADVRHAGGQRFAERKIPALFRLVRQAGDQVNADVADAARAQARDVRQRDGARMQPADRRSIPCPRTTARPDSRD